MNVRAEVLQFLRAQPGAWRTWREIGNHVFADAKRREEKE